MKLGKWLLIVLLVCGGVLALFTARARAQETFVGSWVLDPAASTAAPGMMPTSTAVEITDVGDGKYKSVSEAAMAGVNARSEVTFSVDGKDYTVTAEPAQPGTPVITQSMERVSDMVYNTSLKMGGQQVATALNELSDDGKTLTITTTGAGQFAALSSKMVFRRK
jgi:hypothetical protein